jgi:hypothetical protein
MDDHLIKAKALREKSEKLRAYAEQDDNSETRKSLLAVAEFYERVSAQHIASAGANRTWRR